MHLTFSLIHNPDSNNLITKIHLFIEMKKKMYICKTKKLNKTYINN